MQQMAQDRRATRGFQEKSFFEYHLYTLGRPTSLANNSTKQIELFPSRTDVPVTKTFVYYGLPEQWRYWITPEPNQDRNLGTQSNKKVDIYLQIQNTEKNGMGIPLPAGRLRVYKQDEADADQSNSSAKTSSSTRRRTRKCWSSSAARSTSSASASRPTSPSNYDGHVITESFEIKLRNHKKEPVQRDRARRTCSAGRTGRSPQSSDKCEKQDYRTIHIPVEVPADGEKKVTYTVKYTW